MNRKACHQTQTLADLLSIAVIGYRLLLSPLTGSMGGTRLPRGCRWETAKGKRSSAADATTQPPRRQTPTKQLARGVGAPPNSSLESKNGSSLKPYSESSPITSPADAISQHHSNSVSIVTPPAAQMKASRLPETRLARLASYSSLGFGVGLGAAGEAVRRAVGRSHATGSVIIGSEANIRRIVSTLGRMRGAALKLGQMLSIQDSLDDTLPPQLHSLLERLQNSADYMPTRQMVSVMDRELGKDWREKFEEFDQEPFAAASIGQVHRAKLRDCGSLVAVKIQYPGVGESISSDLEAVRMLLSFGNFLPKGLYLDNTIRVAKQELAREVDYLAEATATRRFGQLLADHDFIRVPAVHDQLCTRRVLVTELVPGVPMGRLTTLPQPTRNKIGKSILELSLRELFEFRFMQTDPNWSNFLFDDQTKKLYLLDFGASREFPEKFTESYKRLLIAAIDNDRERSLEWSRKLGFLTGDETEAMNQAHLASLLTLAIPFRTAGIFDFGKQKISTEVRSQIPIMLKYRLTPPPEESYSLHRKLSGAFLLCAKLQSQVPCKSLFDVYRTT